MRSVRRLLAAVALAALAPPLAAGCTVSSGGGVAFGTYQVYGSSPRDTTGTLSYVCTGQTFAPAIKLSAGLGNSFAPRTLTNGTSSLRYNLYLDAACSSVWGDGNSGTATFVGAGAPIDNQTYQVTVYGRIPPRQNVRAGSYSDTVVVTIEF